MPPITPLTRQEKFSRVLEKVHKHWSCYATAIECQDASNMIAVVNSMARIYTKLREPCRRWWGTTRLSQHPTMNIMAYKIMQLTTPESDDKYNNTGYDKCFSDSYLKCWRNAHKLYVLLIRLTRYATQHSLDFMDTKGNIPSFREM